jgi:hypothetical protein
MLSNLLPCRRRARALLPLLLSLCLPVSAIAQNDAGSLRVLVLDQSGAVVPGATVTATNVGTSTSREAVSDGEGYATFTPVTRGRYDVRVMLSGFRTVDFTGVDVDVNERESRSTARRRPRPCR